MLDTYARLPECGVARFLVLLDGPWATLIVRELIGGPQRFSDLRRALGTISAHTLTSRLRRLEAYAVVTRTAYAEVPPRVVYELTPLGHELETVLHAMGSWASKVDDPATSAPPVRTRLDRSCATVADLAGPSRVERSHEPPPASRRS